MNFKELRLLEPLQRALAQEGYEEPTRIQEEAIPYLLRGRDLLGIAQTGTGKTAAFVLPILQRMREGNISSKRPGNPKVLVLAPTRELAAQIGERFSSYGKFMPFKHAVIFGGVNQHAQTKALGRGVDILVATPGRLLDLMQQGFIGLEEIEFFVLDEADRMLDMGFIHDVKKIVEKLPQQRQSFFFSATMPQAVSGLASRLLHDPVKVEVTPQATPIERIEQRILFVEAHDKDALLFELVNQSHLKRVLVFARTKHRANKVAAMLSHNGIDANVIHGNKSQAHRVRALDDFKGGRTRVLVATDIAARGIDIDDISHVINYDLPSEPETYIHRIGRTARAGADGTAYTFCSQDERYPLHAIERLLKSRIKEMHVDFDPNRVVPAPRLRHGSHGRSGRNRPSRRFGGSRNRDSRSQGHRFSGGRTRSRGGRHPS